MARTALITGITGQEAPYLAELLLSEDYPVHGLLRSTRFGTSLTWPWLGPGSEVKR